MTYKGPIQANIKLGDIITLWRDDCEKDDNIEKDLANAFCILFVLFLDYEQIRISGILFHTDLIVNLSFQKGRLHRDKYVFQGLF